MKNLVFEIKEVIDDESDQDVWVVFESEDHVEQYYTLHSLLYKI